MTSVAWLHRSVAVVRRAEMTWWAVRLSSAAAGFAAVGQLAGIPSAWLWSLAFVPLMAIWSAPDGRAAARRLDRAAGLDAELECAWDHRAGAEPMHVAQRDRARLHFEAQIRGRVVPPPHIAWLLPALLWFAVPIDGPAPDLGAKPSGVETQATSRGAASPQSSNTGDEASAPKVNDRARATQAAAPTPSPDPNAETTAGGRQVAGVGQTGGVGTRAGDRSGGTSGRREVSLRRNVGETLPIGTAPGASDGGALVKGRALVGRSPPPPDAIADPAGPYPRRYQAVIARWFDRERP